jgi:putative PIN family toxin of toxin-antitoxin system
VNRQPIVLDTNVVLDLFIFNDPRCADLHVALGDKALQWTATQPMREELERVLTYTHLQPRMAFYATTATQVLAHFDSGVHIVDTAPRAFYVCKDADDQKFVDLAVQLQSALVSKDKAVLCMRKRLATLGVTVLNQWTAQSKTALQLVHQSVH